MTIIGRSGNETVIVKIDDKYYCITDYNTINISKQAYYHAFYLEWFNESWWKPKYKTRYLIGRETDEVKKDTTDYGYSFYRGTDIDGVTPLVYPYD